MTDTIDRRRRSPNGHAKTTRMNTRSKMTKRRKILLRDGNKCHYCHREYTDDLPPTFDHIVGLKDGGTDDLNNLVLACWPCNNARANDPTWKSGEIPVLANEKWKTGCEPHFVSLD